MQAHPHPGVLRLSAHGRICGAIRTKSPLFVRESRREIKLNAVGQRRLLGTEQAFSESLLSGDTHR
jgi:hypothetical protein